YHVGLLKRLEALDRLTGKSKYALIGKWAITLLILFLEITPALSKVLTPLSSYDVILNAAQEMRSTQLEARHDHQKLKNHVTHQSNTTKFNNHAQKNQQLNQDIYDEMAQAQLELVKLGLKIWKEEMKTQIKSDPSLILKSAHGSSGSRPLHTTGLQHTNGHFTNHLSHSLNQPHIPNPIPQTQVSADPIMGPIPPSTII
ncbi:MAG TPA: DUF4407 domain-containing protein, partial [Catalimonadaceae bacterium]|nr:DUF4407 domain-containing protein [Catalimonadaceae bacterium]